MVNKFWPGFWTSLNSDGNLHQSVKQIKCWFVFEIYFHSLATDIMNSAHEQKVKKKKKKHTERHWRGLPHVFKHLLAMRSRQSLLFHRETVQIAFQETEITWLCYRAKCCFTECLKTAANITGFLPSIRSHPFCCLVTGWDTTVCHAHQLGQEKKASTIKLCVYSYITKRAKKLKSFYIMKGRRYSSEYYFKYIIYS